MTAPDGQRADGFPANGSVAVVGAGVVGLSVALALQRRGLAVTVYERAGVAAGASCGNAGAFAFPDIIPLATPGIMRRAPRWLLDPTGPLSIPPAYALRIAPWLLRFWRASRPDRYAGAIAAQTALMDVSRAALTALAADLDAGAMLHEDGQLQLYEGEAEFRASLPQWAERAVHGVPFRHLAGPEAIAEIQPGLAPRFTHAGFTPRWTRVSDPADWTRMLAERFAARGGRIEITDVHALAPGGDHVRLATGAGDRRVRQVVLCAGAWSGRLARTLGHRIPLETERGYNTTLPAGALDLRTQLTFGGHGFVISRVGDGVRVGGAVELGGLALKPDFRRAKALLAKAKAFLPGLRTEGGVEWMGFRPSLPDSLPVIDRAPGVAGVIYAFGHGHLGLTQSAGTAELVADLATGASPVIDMAPYRADRFSGWPA